MPGITGQPNVTPGGGISQAAADARYAPITPVSSHVTTQFDKTNNTLADVPGLSVPLAVGSWDFRAELVIVTDLGGGQIRLDGTLTSTLLRSVTTILDIDDGTFESAGTSTLLNTTVVQLPASLTHVVIITGVVTVSVAGTLKIKFAQFSTNAAASSVMVGARIVATPVS